MEEFEEKNNQLQALISLLDEPDHSTFSTVRNQIYSFGQQAVPMLEHAWESTFDTFLQKRIEDIIHEIQYNQLYIDLTHWAHLGNQNLLDGYIHFTRSQFQNLDENTIRQQIHVIRRDIWLELNENLTALEKVKVLNHIIFEVHHFRLAPFRKPEIRHLMLNNLLETRTAYSISIGLLYALLAQSLDLPVAGILLPGERFVMAWMDTCRSVEKQPSRVMFYINPENNGGVFTRNEITALLRHMKMPVSDNFYLPVSHQALIDKMFELLIFLHRNVGDPNRINELEHLRSSLT
ncbi:MAG: transglutaminase-like domain-containing protein [Lentimicrobium sp.]|nr:transglutaminase-like domain-containing protein [Lentimicrobium sp.]